MHLPERLGKYLIRRELGRGAMGIVYEGFDPLIERTVAIKVLHLDEADEATAAEMRLRFRREAQAAGRLTHPNIVAVHDYGEEDGSQPGGSGTPSAYIAMEFVKGRDLKRLFAAGTRFTLAETGRIMGELLSALQHAHEQGVVHRDIKPANIMLLDSGAVKVADFGIAKFDSSELTQVGSVLGTVSHMSPEQLLGQPVDRRTDLFSCGVLLYELLTGDRPFSGSPATVMQKVLHERPLAPSMIIVSLPQAIDEVVHTAMAKNPAQRYASADAFAAALRAALAEPHAVDADATVAWPAARTPPATPAGHTTNSLAGTGSLPVPTPAPPTRRAAPARTALYGALGAIGLAAAGLGGWALTRPAPEPASPRTLAQAGGSAIAPAAPTGPASAPLPVPVPVPTLMAASVPAPAPAPAPNVVPSTMPAPPAMAVTSAPRPAAPAASKAAAAAAKPRAASPSTAMAPAPPPAASPSAAMAPALPSAAKESAGAGKLECLEEALRGLARCQVAVGTAYRFGKGVPRDVAEAVRWYRKAADQGDATGQYELGAMYDIGLGVPKDDAQAFAWFRKAADQSYARAQNRMGLAYERGVGVPPNLAMAADWFRKAADQGLAFGTSNLGRLTLRGRGVTKDVAQGVALLQKAAAQGEGNASFHLGVVHENGEDKPRDLRQAARLYREALSSTTLTDANRARANAFLAAHDKP